MFGVITSRGIAKHTRRSERMNAILTHVAKSCSQRNYT